MLRSCDRCTYGVLRSQNPRPSLRVALLSDEVRLLDPPHRRILGADNLINPGNPAHAEGRRVLVDQIASPQTTALAMTKGEDRDSGLLRAYGPRNDEGPIGPHPRPSLRVALLSDEAI
jgi:hypothetical protein